MSTYLTVILMALVTYLPRWVPMTLLNNRQLPERLETFLKFIPYAALGALIFPDILYSTESLPASIVGMSLAIFVANLRVNIVFVVLAAIMGAYGFDIIFG